mgnify:CR=1 FL=1
MSTIGKQGFLYSNDKAGQYPDSYYFASANQIPQFAKQQGTETTDVCVIGAGFTGLSAALHLAKSGYDVILLDAHRVGWGASGRNGGQLGSDQRQGQDELESQYGKDAAKALWNIAQDANVLCRSLIQEHDIQCDLTDGIIHADQPVGKKPVACPVRCVKPHSIRGRKCADEGAEFVRVLPRERGTIGQRFNLLSSPQVF